MNKLATELENSENSKWAEIGKSCFDTDKYRFLIKNTEKAVFDGYKVLL